MAEQPKRFGLAAFLRREPIFVIAVLAAAVSCCFVPPDRTYLSYLDFRTLALLYGLMLVAAGLQKAGAADALARMICLRAKNARVLGLLLVSLTFFSSMLITNDVALLTFVPFSVLVLSMTGRRQDLITLVVLQTVAANLGSMLTPVGNPQNLYLCSHYGFSAGEFFRITGPVWLLSLLLTLGLCFLIPAQPLEPPALNLRPVDRKMLLLYGALFLVSLCAVFRLIPWQVLLVVLVAALLLLDRRMLLRADFFLLLTFVAFFLFAGNLSRLEPVDKLLRRMLEGREYLTALAASQVISNVPAALLLSGFTQNARDLLLGVDIGGLGTPIASLASLISLKLYSRTEGARTGRFLLVFTVINVVLLALLSAAQLWI